MIEYIYEYTAVYPQDNNLTKNKTLKVNSKKISRVEGREEGRERRNNRRMVWPNNYIVFTHKYVT